MQQDQQDQSNMQAHVDWIGWRPGFGGTVTLHQERPDGPTTVEVALQLPEGGKLNYFWVNVKHHPSII